jgi:hypothetical protein
MFFYDNKTQNMLAVIRYIGHKMAIKPFKTLAFVQAESVGCPFNVHLKKPIFIGM